MAGQAGLPLLFVLLEYMASGEALSHNFGMTHGFRSLKSVISVASGVSRIQCTAICGRTSFCTGINYHSGAQRQCQILGNGCGGVADVEWIYGAKDFGMIRVFMVVSQS